MQSRLTLAVVGASLLVGLVLAQAPRPRLNPVISLIEQKKPVMGLYAPSNRRMGAPGPEAPPQKSAVELAQETVAYKSSDFVFDGSMESNFDQALSAFSLFAAALKEAGALRRTPFPHLAYPMIVKIPEIAPDPAKATEYISRQLNLGVSGIMFVSVESAEEVRQGLAAMRFRSKGGTRPDSVGTAPAFWGLSEEEYRKKADLWPVNPDGELINWTIIESKEGLAHVREIAAVKGIGVLWPGAGTLRGLFSTTGPDGKRVLDEPAWERAIQQVLAACKEFNVPCGYPASANDIELRMKQGFSVFVMNWGDQGFKAIEVGRKVASRPTTNQ